MNTKKWGLLAIAGLLGAGSALADIRVTPAISACIGGYRCQPSLRIVLPAYSRVESLDFYASSASPGYWVRNSVNILLDGRLLAANVDVTGINRFQRVILSGNAGSILEIQPAAGIEIQLAGVAITYDSLGGYYPYPQPPRPYPPYPLPRPVLRSELVTCQSWSDAFASCATSFGQIRGVRVVDQISGHDCKLGKTYGFDSRSVWVNKGCRATFEVTGY